MRRPITKALSLLTPSSYWHFWSCVFLAAASAISETIALTSILPFFQEALGITNHISILYWKFLESIFQNHIYNFNRAHVLGVISLCFLIISVVIRLINVWVGNNFSHSQRYHISSLIFAHFVNNSFTKASQIDQSEVQNIILSEVDQVTDLIFIPIISIVNALMLLISLTAALVVIDAPTALTALIFFSSMYLLVLFLTRRSLANLGRHRNVQNKKRFEVVRDYVENLKYMNFMKLSSNSLMLFTKASKVFANNLAMNASIAQIPRYVIEFATIGSLIIAGMYVTDISKDGGNEIVQMLPFIGLLGLSSLRMLPAFQALYHGISYINFGEPALDNINRFLLQSSKEASEPYQSKRCPEVQKLELHSVNFTYSSGNRHILNECSYTFYRGKSYSIIGASGTGKSTLLDVLLGLRMPTKGTVTINEDCSEITSVEFQNQCGLVLQNSTILEGTVKDNLTFFNTEIQVCSSDPILSMLGTAPSDDDILKRLDQRVYPNSGMSGGQSQRIALARALLRKPSVLFLDEATSALDKRAAKDIMQKIIDSFEGIIIHITHDIEIAQQHDYILELVDGKLICHQSQVSKCNDQTIHE